MLWLGMRLMNPPSSPGCHARGLRHVTGKDDMRSGNVTPGLGRPFAVTMRRAASSTNRSHVRGTAPGKNARSGRQRARGSRSLEGRGMHGQQDGAAISQAYQDHRPYLGALAFRMLGDIGAAEDIVQDTVTRLMAANLGEVEDDRAWPIVVTTPLCLAQIHPPPP